MSHSSGAIKFNDGLILYCKYNGTVDIMIPHLYKTYDEMHEMWRQTKSKWCGHEVDEEVKIFSSYGGGFSWTGRACRDCMVITKNLSCDYDTETDGIPEWYQQ